MLSVHLRTSVDFAVAVEIVFLHLLNYREAPLHVHVTKW